MIVSITNYYFSIATYFLILISYYNNVICLNIFMKISNNVDLKMRAMMERMWLGRLLGAKISKTLLSDLISSYKYAPGRVETVKEQDGVFL